MELKFERKSTETLCFVVDTKFSARLRELAKEHQVTVSDVIRQLMEFSLDTFKNKATKS